MNENNGFYPYMDDLKYEYESDSLEYADLVAERRRQVYRRDASLLKDKGVNYRFEDWNELPEGRFDLDYNGVPVECVFHKKEGPLYVILNAALFNSDKLPEFKRWSYAGFLPGSTLNIADPMYRICPELLLGWYYGTKKHNLRWDIAQVILKTAQMLGLENKDITIIGSSGGGAAAIHIGYLIPGSTVVAINAQLKLSRYYYHKTFTAHTGIELYHSDVFMRNDTTQIMRRYTDSPTKVLLIENLRSRVDRVQVDHLKKFIPIEVKYGISTYKNLTIWMYDADYSGRGGSHGAQEYREMLFAILHLTRMLGDTEQLEKSKDLYRLFSEMWNDHFQQVEKINQLQTKMEKIQANGNRICKRIKMKCSPEEIDSKEWEVREEEIEMTSESKYGVAFSYRELQPNTMYCLSIADSECGVKNDKDGEDLAEDSKKGYTVLIKDDKIDYPYAVKRCKSGKRIHYFFHTSLEVDEMELRIYCGYVGKTDGVSIHLKDVRLINMRKGN